MSFIRNGTLAIALFFSSVPCWSQGNSSPIPTVDPGSEPLVTDRPDFTESALAVPNGFSQAEFGGTITQSAHLRESGVGELLLRIGYKSHTEIRIGLPTYTRKKANPDGNSSGFTDTNLGIKFGLVRAGDRLGFRQFDIGFIIETTIPTGSSTYRGERLQPGAKLLVGSALTHTVSVSGNLNWDYVSENKTQYGEVASSVSFGFEISEKVGTYIEYFGFYPTAKDQHSSNFVNTGVTYLMDNNVQLDARTGRGLNGIQNDYFLGVGLSLRFR